MVRSLRLFVCLVCAAGCGTSVDVMRPRPPLGPPGSEARSGDQAEPRLEPLPDSHPASAPASALDRAAELSRQSAEQRDAGDLAAALRLQQEALAIREQVLGPDHLSVAATLNAIAASRGLRATMPPPNRCSCAPSPFASARSERTMS
jgi:hypothetical protein